VDILKIHIMSCDKIHFSNKRDIVLNTSFLLYFLHLCLAKYEFLKIDTHNSVRPGQGVIQYRLRHLTKNNPRIFYYIGSTGCRVGNEFIPTCKQLFSAQSSKLSYNRSHSPPCQDNRNEHVL
jgi:hypothetical protein